VGMSKSGFRAEGPEARWRACPPHGKRRHLSAYALPPSGDSATRFREN